MRNFTKSLSSLDGQPDGKGGDRFLRQSLKTPKFQSGPASKKKKYYLSFWKSFMRVLNLFCVLPKKSKSRISLGVHGERKGLYGGQAVTF